MECGADGITFHLEATRDVPAVIRKIHEKGVSVGISIKPDTSLEEIYPYLANIDMVLVMSVEPGFGGQKFIPESYAKIQTLKQYINAHAYNVKIEVDGGVGKKNVREVLRAGADIIVAGSGVFKKQSIKENITRFQEAFQEMDNLMI